MKIATVRETASGETRVAITPDSIKKYLKLGVSVLVEKSAGAGAGYSDDEYRAAGAEMVSREQALAADAVLCIHPPADADRITKGAILIGMLAPYQSGSLLEKLAAQGVSAIAMELVPRTSRAQSMDVLSSQAGIAGYRAVIEAAARFKRFTMMMMTSAGSAKPAKIAILGCGVAGLQAIATAKRLGAVVEAYDIRPEVKEQILSLGAKFIDIDLGESGTGSGGYAKELSEEGKQKQQRLLNEKLKKFDIIITTANVPGRKAPTLVTEDAVLGMRSGSVLIDMAAPSGGNCPLTEPGKIVEKNGVTIVGELNYPALVAGDASNFYARNLQNLLALVIQTTKEGSASLNWNLEDDIVDAALVTHNGALRKK